MPDGQATGSNAYHFENETSPGEIEVTSAIGEVSAAFQFNSASADKQYEYLATMDSANGNYADNISGSLMLEVIA